MSKRKSYSQPDLGSDHDDDSLSGELARHIMFVHARKEVFRKTSMKELFEGLVCFGV